MGQVPLLGQGNESNGSAPVVKAKTAFLIYIEDNGQVMLTPDTSTPLDIERLPHPDEVTGAVYAVLVNLQAQQGAAHTVNGMMQMGSAMAQAQQNQHLLKDLKL